MASQIQALVKSLQETQRQQSEQLHLTRQLVDAVPLPISVRGAGGQYLSVNRAWKQLFDTHGPDSVGQSLPSEVVTLPIRDREIQVTTARGESLDAALFKAAFTTVDGAAAGTISALVDITARKQAQAELVTEKERAEVTLASIGDGVITTGLTGRIDSINVAARLLTGSTVRQAHGSLLADIFRLERDTDHEPPSGNLVADLPTTSTVVQATNRLLVHRSGERYVIDYTAAPIRTGDGETVGCVLVFRDVTRTRVLEQKISWQARHDVLTGLNNRAALTEQLAHAVSLARRNQTSLAVCHLDLNHFQAVNDQYGNRLGDRLLKDVAQRLQGFAGIPDNIARIGGDEFVVLLTDQINRETIEARVTQLREHMGVPYALDGTVVDLPVSVGVAIFPQDDVTPDTLLRHADQAMCQAKNTGRNRVYGLEALLRWQHPEQGLVEPAHFLGLVDTTDLMIDIGEWVLHQGMGQLRRWEGMGFQWVVSVNIAALHFHRPDFVSRLHAILDAYPDVSPRLLELEILESAALEDVKHMHGVMRSCQALGVRFALDDFDTGFSSLSYLKRLPAETIKIDQTFVRGILDDDDDLTLVVAIVALAKAFNRHVIAEGVETVAHGQRLLQLGCELAQGYGIARPMPPEHVVSWAEGYRFFDPDLLNAPSYP